MSENMTMQDHTKEQLIAMLAATQHENKLLADSFFKQVFCASLNALRGDSNKQFNNNGQALHDPKEIREALITVAIKDAQEALRQVSELKSCQWHEEGRKCPACKEQARDS